MSQLSWLLVGSLLFASTAHAQNARVDINGLKVGEQHDRFIVQYRADAQVANLAAARARVQRAVAASPSAYSTVAPSVVRGVAPGAYLVRSSQPMNAVAAEAWMRRLAEDNAIEFVEVDVKLRELATANDKWFTSQLHLFARYGVGADVAWDMNRGDGINVGVVDSGPTPHADLDASLLPGYDFVDGDADPRTPQCLAMGGTHGTKVAGTIAAVTNNNRGIAGVAPAVRIVPARVMTGCGGQGESTTTSDLIRAIDWLSGGTVEGVPRNANPVEVINISLGAWVPCTAASQAAIARANKLGVVVVVAAGNEDVDTARSHPANCNGVVAVGAVDHFGQRTWYSNWGATVDVAAPGQIVWPRADDSGITGDEGTSFSAPMVAGIVAMMQSATNGALNTSKVELLLEASASPFRARPDKAIGTGIANAPSAISMAQSIHAPKFKGSYVMVARGLLPGQQGWNGCLIVGNNGNASRPDFWNWGRGGAPETCGLGDDDALVANAQAVWDVTPVTDSNGVTAHILRSRVNGQCLIRSVNGTDNAASLYLWNDIADRTWCGHASADAFIANGQAAWYFDSPSTKPGTGEMFTTVGLKQVRPNFAFLGFAPGGAPGETRFRNAKEWEFRLHPVPGLPPGIQVGVPYRIVSKKNGQCLDISGGVSQGGRLITWPCHNGDNQKFVFQGQQWRVGGKCLDIKDGKQAYGTVVQAWSCLAGANQRWTMTSEGGIRSLMPGTQFCLEVHAQHDNHVRTSDCYRYAVEQQFLFRAF